MYPHRGGALVFNTAHLNGSDIVATVNGPQIGQTCTNPDDPATCSPVYAQYPFTCVAGANLSSQARAKATCDEPIKEFFPGEVCTYVRNGYVNGAGLPVFDAYFATVFPLGVTIGDTTDTSPTDTKHDASWTATGGGPANLKTYLASSPSGTDILTADTINATSTSGRNFARQVAALTLNVGFVAAGVTGGSDPLHYRDLQLCNLVEGTDLGSGYILTATQAAALNGHTISQVLTDANSTLGGNALPAYVDSFNDWDRLATILNEAFDEFKPRSFAEKYLCR